MPNALQQVDRQALRRSIMVGLGLTVASNAAGYILYLIVSGGEISPTILAMPLALNGFLLFLYLAYGAAYVTFANEPSWQEGAAGGGLTGLTVSFVSLILSSVIILVMFGPQTGEVLRQGLIDSGIGSIGVFNAMQSALIVIGGGSLGVTLFSITMSAVSGALYAASGPDGYEPPRWWR